MSQDLTGKKIAITGASSGIGEATGIACAQAGAAVALGARRTDRIEELAKKIEGEGGRAVAIETDVADAEQARAFVEGAREQLGGLDVLVNNAGVMLLGPINGAPLEEWQRMVDVNVLGLLYCTHAAFPAMVEQGSGHVINVSSVAGRIAREGSGVYNLTKFGVGAFSESLRQEGARSGVRVTLVEPGAVDTELAGHNRDEVLEGLKKRFEDITRLEGADIANAIVYTIAQPEHVSINEVLVRPTEQVG